MITLLSMILGMLLFCEQVNEPNSVGVDILVIQADLPDHQCRCRQLRHSGYWPSEVM